MISIKKNLVNTLYSMINKKADKIQNNEEQEKKPSRIQYVQRLNKLVLLLHTYVKINNNVIIKAL